MNRPRCKYCDAALPKHTILVSLDRETPAKELLGTSHKLGGTIKEIIRDPKTYSVSKSRIVSVWCGDFGRYGDNSFCGLRCGYNWSIRTIKRAKK